MWASVVTAVQALIFTLGHLAGGSLGSGIFLAALALRITLLPVSVRLARRARRRQARLAALQPALRRLQDRFRNDPARLNRRTLALLHAHDCQPLDPGDIIGGAVQLPPLSAMYAVLRRGLGAGVSFAWIPNLAAADVGLVGIVAVLAVGGALVGAPPSVSRGTLVASAVIAGGVTAAFLLTTSSAMALSVAASSIVGGAQGWWLRREERRVRPPMAPAIGAP